MNELPNVSDLSDFEEHQRRTAAQEGVQAVERQLFPGEMTNAVEISLWVRGRELRTVVDNETVHRLMAILVGEP
jgi:hypothetical protein